jgi:hypothetical protein
VNNKRFHIAMVAGLLGLAALYGCTPSAKQEAPIPANLIPEGLKDCAFYELSNGAGTRYHIVRCPMSSVSLTRPGKNAEHTVTIDSSVVGVNPEDIARAKQEFDAAALELKRKEIEVRISQAEAAIAANKAALEQLK